MTSDGPQERPETLIPIRPDSLLGKGLVYFFGLYQFVHVFVNLRALFQFRNDDETFPAFPPPEGWDGQVTPFFTGMAALDLANAVLTLVFVREFRRDGPHWPTLGIVTASISAYAAVLFGYVTRRAGAWRQHPAPYRLLYLAYVPCVVLFGYLWRWVLGSTGNERSPTRRRADE